MQFRGVVVHGKGIGRKLGIPTANLAMDGVEGVRYGVYAAKAALEGKAYPAVANVGRHPTLPEGPPTVEVHILDASMDVYGKEMTVTLMRYLRPEMQFDSVEALRAQIMKDIEAARQ